MPVNRPDAATDAAAALDRSSRIAVDLRRLPWMRRLALDYAFHFDSLAPFFAGNPADSSAWALAIRRSQTHARPHDEVAAMLAAQQERRQAPARARAAARQLADPRTVAIVTGQQTGLFGGPLYTLLKAITAIKLAEQVSRDHQVTAVPVFWMEAEDHDWDEVRGCTVFDEAFAPRALALPPRATDLPEPVAATRLDDSIHKALEELEQCLAPTEFRASLIADLHDAYRPGVGMADAFGRWLERTLGDRGLIVYDASDISAKTLVRDVFTRELAMPGQTAMLAARAGAGLAAAGYHAQVHPQENNVALFHMSGARRPIQQDGDDFLVGDTRCSRSALLDEAAREPGHFSPNVLLRPIVQDSIFPTVCYVGGPSELAYLGQLRGVYEHFGVPMPLISPRATATLVDSAAFRFLTKYDVPLETLQPQDEASLNALLQSHIPPVIEQAFAEAGEQIDRRMTHLAEALSTLDPTLEGAARSTLGKMQHDIQTLHGKMIQAAKRRDETLRRQYTRTRALTFPGGHMQERTIGFVSFLNQYGPALIDRLFEEIPIELGHHWIIAI